MTTPFATDPPPSSYARLCQPTTLQTAWKLVQRGGPAAGVDGCTLEQFAARASRELQTILEDLRQYRYLFLPVRRTFVAKLIGPPRRLGIPTVRDRIVEQALRLVLEPILSPGFSVGSFAYRAGRGVHSALQALLAHRRSGMAWILQSDIQDFFDSIDHAILQTALIRAKIEPELVDLIGRFLAAGVRLGSRWFPSHRGLCQGSPLSPLLANFYLNPFDHALQRAGYELLRYADDFLVCCRSHHQARQALDEVTRQLARLKLTTNPAKTRILDSRQESFDFLGFLVTPNGLQPSEANIQRFRQTLSDLTAPNSTLPLTELIAQINPLIRSFRCFYQHCQADSLFAALDAWIAARLTPHLKRNGTNNLSPERLYTKFGLQQLAAPQARQPKNNPSARPGYHAWLYGRPWLRSGHPGRRR